MNSVPVMLVGIAGSCKGASYRLRTPTITIGSAKTCDFVVTGRLVSDVHATLEMFDDGRVVLRNRSPHGTLVNREAADVRPLQSADRIQIGEGGIVELRLGGSSATVPKAGKSGKPKFRVVLISIYLAGMAVLMVFLSSQPQGHREISSQAITAAMTKSRSQLLDRSWWKLQSVSGAAPPATSEIDPSADYYQIQSMVASGAPAEQVAAKADELLQRLQEQFLDARMLEQRERWQDARILYHRIMESAPDTRLAVTQLVSEQLTELDRRVQNAR